jgi:hypothetical protein
VKVETRTFLGEMFGMKFTGYCLLNICFAAKFLLLQCCATFLHSRHTKYCRRVMAAHQPHFAYCGGEGGDGCVTFQFHVLDLSVLCLSDYNKENEN